MFLLLKSKWLPNLTLFAHHLISFLCLSRCLRARQPAQIFLFNNKSIDFLLCSCSNTSFNHKSISSFFYPYRQACSGTPASKFFIFLVSDLFTSTRSVASSEGSPLKISKDYHPTHVVSCPRWGNRKSKSFF